MCQYVGRLIARHVRPAAHLLTTRLLHDASPPSRVLAHLSTSSSWSNMSFGQRLGRFRIALRVLEHRRVSIRNNGGCQDGLLHRALESASRRARAPRHVEFGGPVSAAAVAVGVGPAASLDGRHRAIEAMVERIDRRGAVVVGGATLVARLPLGRCAPSGARRRRDRCGHRRRYSRTLDRRLALD